MRAQHAAKKIMSGPNIGYPIAHGLIDGVFEGARSRLYASYFCPEQAHTEHVQFLAPHILSAHINDAFEAEQRANRGGSDAVLARSSFGDDATFPHTFRQQSLPEAVIDFVRPGVKKIFAFKIDFCAAEFVGEPAGKKQRRRSARVCAQSSSRRRSNERSRFALS